MHSRALLIRFHFLLSHKYVSVKVIMAQSFPAICRGDAGCIVLNIRDVDHVGMSEELTRMPSCSNSSVVHPFLSFPSRNSTYLWMPDCDDRLRSALRQIVTALR